MDAPFLEKKLTRADYLRSPFYIAKRILLGGYLCTRVGGCLTAGKITEVEVYLGGRDKASHTCGHRRTRRTEVQFREGGCAYVFKIYGMHDHFCVVTGAADVPDAILIRSLEPTEGIDIMKHRRGVNDIGNLTTGPGKLCRALGITTRAHYGADLLGDEVWISPKQQRVKAGEIIATPRIGVEYAAAYALKPWRFLLPNTPYVSR